MEWKRIWHKKMVGITFLLLFIALFFYAKEQFSVEYSVFDSNAIRNACNREYQGEDLQKAAEDLQKRSDFSSNMSEYIGYKEMKYDMGAFTDDYTKERLSEFTKEYPEIVEAYNADKDAYDREEESLKSQVYSDLAEKYTYVAGYDARMEAIQENAKRLNSISIFADSGSFSDKNIEKTAQDFKEAAKVKTELGNNDFITSVFQYKAAYYIALVFGMILAMQMLAERKKGLWPVIYASPNGRSKLAVRRLVILLVSIAAFVLILYMGLFVMSGIFHGWEWNWWRDIQSISQFDGITKPMKEPVFLLLYYITVVLGVYISTLCIWVLLAVFDNRILSLFCVVLLYGLGYLLYHGLSDQSILVLLRYINLYYVLCAGDMWGGYLNLNVAGLVVNRITLVCVLGVLIGGAMMFVSIVIAVKKHPVHGVSRLTRFLEKITIQLGRCKEYFRGSAMEMYKLLVWNKGIWVLVFLGVWGSSNIIEMSLTESMTEQFMKGFYEEYAGPVTKETLVYVNDLKKEVTQIQEQYKEAAYGYKQGTVEEKEYQRCRNIYEQAEVKIESYARISSEVAYAQNASKSLGYPVWILNDSGYKRLIGTVGYRSQVLEGLKILLAIVLIMSGMFSVERKRDMKPLLCATLHGRWNLIEKKVIAAAIITLLVMAVVYIPDMISICKLFPIDHLLAPLKSLSFMAYNTFEGSILLYFVYMFAIRFAIFFAVAMVIGAISTVCSMEVSVMAGMVLLVPSILQAMQIFVLEKLSLVHYSSVVIWQINGTSGTELLAYVILAGVIFVAVKAAYQFWCGNVEWKRRSR